MLLPLVGLPRPQLDALADALATADVDTALLHALLEGGFPGTPLGDALAEWLSSQCVLPATLGAREGAAWRCVLLHALRLPRAHWEVECIAERPMLGAETADTDPLLQRLRDALYRPVDVAPAAWRARLATHRAEHGHADARQLALLHQRAHCGNACTEMRHAAMEARLRALAPQASPRTLQRALRHVRQHEQRDAGLLDPRAGLPAILSSARGTAPVAAIHARLAAMQGDASHDDGDTLPDDAPPLAARLLAVAHDARLDALPSVRPLGRYDSVARALVSALSGPWQLPQLAAAGFDLAYAGTVGARLLGSTRLPSPDRVADVAQQHARDAAWMRPLSVVACTPNPGEAPFDDSAALLGRQRSGTAVALRGQCREEQRTVPGLLREQAAAMGALLARQPSGRPRPPARSAADNPASSGEPKHSAVPHVQPLSRHVLTTPRAAAGALTDLGIALPPASDAGVMFPGAGAQGMLPMRGTLPLAVLVPLIDRIPPRAWWEVLDWQVQRTPSGLHAAVADAFRVAGIDLQQRPPSVDGLSSFFDSAPVRGWYASLLDLPQLPEGARRSLADGDHAARAYAFSRMLDVLTHDEHDDAEAPALHALARLGAAATGYVQAQTDAPLTAAHAHFDALAWQTATVSGRLAAPMSDAQLDAHRARMRQAYGMPVAHGDDAARVRQWLVASAPALLDDTGFEVLDDADRLLADLLVALRQRVDGLRFGAGWDWRGSAPTPADWRDHLERTAAVAGTHWATELGALFHHIAASLARYDDLEPAVQAVIDPRRNDLRVLAAALIAPVVRLYAGLDLPMERADPWYGTAYATCAAFFDWVGTTRSADALARLDAWHSVNDAARLRRLLPAATLTLPLPAAVLQHLLGHQRHPASAEDQERDLLRLFRGTDSRQLIAQVLDVAVDDVAPELAHAFFRTLARVRGGEMPGEWRDAFQRGSTWHLSPAEWLTLQPAPALAALWRSDDTASDREGLVNIVTHAMAGTVEARLAQGVPTLWTRIVEGPQAVDAWCATDDARRSIWRHLLRVVPGGIAPSRLDRAAPLSAATCAALLAASAEAQLALPGGGHVDPADGAPALSLAIALRARHPALTVDEALAFGIVLLPPSARVAPMQRAVLDFPLLVRQRDTSVPQAAEDAALPEHALREAHTELDAAPGPDAGQLPPLDDLLDAFGLSLLHPRTGDDSEAAPLAAVDAWALMARTRPFAEFCQPLLVEAGWYPATDDAIASPRGPQTLLARLMLERYVGRGRIDALRERLAMPEVVDRPFTVLADELRAEVLRDNADASPAALGILYWLLASELGQPALLVGDIPDDLVYGRSLLSVALRHAATFLDTMQPGACSRIDFDTLTALPAQLALPPHAAGEHDALHDAWARALVPAAVAYASAHGAIPNTTRLDAVRGEQISDALAFLQERQGQHALHVQQLASPAPRRMDVAAQTLREAGIPPTLWSQRPADIGEDYLAQRGIVPSRLIAFETHLFALGKPSVLGGEPADDPQARVVVTNDDSLQALLVADAYLSTSGPTTADRYATEFDAYQRRVEAGLAGLIATALDGLPASDRQRIDESICTTLRVSCDDRQADQGLLLRCDPAGSDAASVYYEVVPQAGLARRAWQDPVLGPLIDFEALVSGAVRRTRDGNQLNPLSGATLTSYGSAIVGSGPEKVPGIARMAAAHLWQPVLERARSEELAHLTGLEQRWQRERHMLNQLAEFTVPGYTCAEQLQAGNLSLATAANCAMDVPIMPIGGFIGRTVGILETAGERSFQSIAAEAGAALATLGVELARKGGLGTIESVGQGALWVGSHAWNSALQGAGWLRRVLRSGSATEGSAQALERAMAHGTAPAEALQEARARTPSLAEARLADGSAVLIAAHGTSWHRFDLITGRGYGPPLEGFTFEHPLPSTLPAVRTEHGLRVGLGATPAQFLRHDDDDWEVLLHGQRYRLDANGDALEADAAHPRPAAPGHWREALARCRPRRSLDMLPCAQQSKLRFVPDAAKELQADGLPAERVEGVAAATREFTLDVSRQDADSGGPLRLMVHKGEVCSWTPTRRGATPQLVPLPASQPEALGLPATVTYRETLRGTLSDARTFGLPGELPDAQVDRLQQLLPVVDVGALVDGIEDARRLRAIRVESPFLRALCIEPDDGVFYQAALPERTEAGTSLPFTRLQPGRDDAAINVYLRAAEAYRVRLLRPYLEQDRENIARLAFGYIKPTLGPELSGRFPTYEAYVAAFAERGRPDVLTAYADKVLTGQREQRTFVGLARQRIPDWQALTVAAEDERASVAQILNALLPATGGKGTWSGIDAAALALPDAGRPILDHLKGANLAFAEVVDADGTRTIYYALSGGKRARNIHLRATPTLGDGTRFVDARAAMQGVAPLPGITSLPVLRHADDTRTLVFDRGVDSERLIASCIDRHRQPAGFRLFSLLDTCDSCGGVVLPQLRARFPDATPFSVRYLQEYSAPSPGSIRPAPCVGGQAQPDSDLVTYFSQWRRDRGLP